ncbi:MAG: AsnC family transcriptional regulator, partial [Chloroflexota bacterium]|nr:AsnC family transcriptional regulator [Chloroflexota bacterium]
DRLLINHLQGGFPLCSRPYHEVGERLGLSEEEVIARLRRLLEVGALTRLGAILDAPRLGGERTLAAMQVPPERVEEVAAAINRHPEISHNYQREHRFNVWFVVSSEDGSAVQRVIHKIEAETGLNVMNLPSLEEYYVEFRFPLSVD